jgi:hypothetical protein
MNIVMNIFVCRDRVELSEISCGYPERRDLIMLRNQLVQNLAATPQDIDPGIQYAYNNNKFLH